jgi:YD repeat-containing protein
MKSIVSLILIALFIPSAYSSDFNGLYFISGWSKASKQCQIPGSPETTTEIINYLIPSGNYSYVETTNGNITYQINNVYTPDWGQFNGESFQYYNFNGDWSYPILYPKISYNFTLNKNDFWPFSYDEPVTANYDGEFTLGVPCIRPYFIPEDITIILGSVGADISKILLNGVAPTIILDNHTYKAVYHLHAPACGEQLKVSPVSTDLSSEYNKTIAWGCGVSTNRFTIYRTDLKACNIQVPNLIYIPQQDGNIYVSGYVGANRNFNWTLSLPGGQQVTGTENDVFALWDGRDGNGNTVPAGSYAATLSAQTSDGVCSNSKSIPINVESSCSLKISKFHGTATTLNPSSGGSVPFSGTITDDSVKPLTWTITLPNGQTVRGSGTSPSATWDGTDANGKVVDPGAYSATLTAQSADGECHDTSTASVNVRWNAQCSLEVTLGSSANVASGNLSHGQELFSNKGTELATSMSLYYNSKDPHSASVGTGWSHSYDISLKQNKDGSVALHEENGKRKHYTLGNGAYVSQSGDYATLVKNENGTFTLTQKDGTKYNFASGGSISSIVDRNGNAISFSYTGNNLTTVTDPMGANTTLAYDANNRIVSLSDPSGNSYTFAYSGNTLATVTYPGGGQWQYTYDANAFMLTKTDPLGNTTIYTYDANHRVVSSTDPEGKIRSITYPEPGTDVAKTTTFTEKDGGVWTYRYDTQAGTLTSKTDPQGGVTSYTYDASGNRTSTTLPDGTTTTSTYDAAGNMTSTTDALGQTTSYTYSAFGQVLTIKDPQGGVTTYTYDAAGNMMAMTDPAGATTQYQYDAKGNVTKVTNPLGQATTFVYDAAGNLISVTDPAGATTSFTYDGAGNMTSQTDANGATTRFEYDARNRLVKVTDPQENVTTYAYDANGNKTSQIDANGNTTKYEYNFQGKLVKGIDALGNVTTYAYGGTGCPSCGGGTDKLTSLTDANGNATIYQYDTLGRLLSETDPLGIRPPTLTTPKAISSPGRTPTAQRSDTLTMVWEGCRRKRIPTLRKRATPTMRREASSPPRTGISPTPLPTMLPVKSNRWPTLPARSSATSTMRSAIRRRWSRRKGSLSATHTTRQTV